MRFHARSVTAQIIPLPLYKYTRRLLSEKVEYYSTPTKTVVFFFFFFLSVTPSIRQTSKSLCITRLGNCNFISYFKKWNILFRSAQVIFSSREIEFSIIWNVRTTRWFELIISEEIQIAINWIGIRIRRSRDETLEGLSNSFSAKMALFVSKREISYRKTKRDQWRGNLGRG